MTVYEKLIYEKLIYQLQLYDKYVYEMKPSTKNFRQTETDPSEKGNLPIIILRSETVYQK